MILKNILKILSPIIISFAIYIQIQAEDAIGGGFQSGLILASGMILYSIAHNKTLPINFLKKIAALGVMIYFSVGMLSMINGKSFLDYGYLGQGLGICIIEIGVAFTVFSAISAIYIMVAHD